MPKPHDQQNDPEPPTRVLAVGAQGPCSPGFRVRVSLPASELRRYSIDTIARPLFSADEDRSFRSAGLGARSLVLSRARKRLERDLQELSPSVDVALIQRQADMLPSLKLEGLAAAGHRLVLDVDDAIWIDTSRAAGGHPLAFLKNSRRKVRELAARADSVIAGNLILAEWINRYAKSVVIVPSLVDPRSAPVREHEPRERVVWGWIGSPSSAATLYDRLPSLERAAEKLGGRAELLVVGAPMPRGRRIRIRSIPWSEEAERWALANIDVGLMPLRDDAWTRGKCAYKAVQYMSAGVPVVSDDVGVSADVVGGAGAIVDRHDPWSAALVRLSRDADLRTVLGREGRERANREFSVERWAPVLAETLRGGGSA